jgi:hypothetical protein
MIRTGPGRYSERNAPRIPLACRCENGETFFVKAASVSCMERSIPVASRLIGLATSGMGHERPCRPQTGVAGLPQ